MGLAPPTWVGYARKHRCQMTRSMGSEAGEDEVDESACDSQAGGVANGATEPSWLAAYTRPRHEERVKQFCEERGIEVFLPTHRSWRRWSDRKKLLSLPLFPSYVFVRADGAQRQRAVQAPGFLWFVHNRTGPVLVAADELGAIRRLMASGMEYDPLPGVQVGDEVEVVAGALRGCRGRLLRKDGSAIALFVTGINGGIRVSLPDPSWVVPAGSRRAMGAAVGGPLPRPV